MNTYMKIMLAVMPFLALQTVSAMRQEPAQSQSWAEYLGLTDTAKTDLQKRVGMTRRERVELREQDWRDALRNTTLSKDSSAYRRMERALRRAQADAEDVRAGRPLRRRQRIARAVARADESLTRPERRDVRRRVRRAKRTFRTRVATARKAAEMKSRAPKTERTTVTTTTTTGRKPRVSMMERLFGKSKSKTAARA